MLKRKLIFAGIVMLVFAFTGTTYGQTSKRTTSKAKAGKGTKGKVQFQDFHFGHRRSKTTQVTGGTIPVYKNGKSSTKRKRTPAKNSFQSQTQPFADGRSKNQRKGGITHTDSWNEKNKRKFTKSTNILPYVEQDNLRKKSKYANQEISYRKNKPVRRKNK